MAPTLLAVLGIIWIGSVDAQADEKKWIWDQRGGKDRSQFSVAKALVAPSRGQARPLFQISEDTAPVASFRTEKSARYEVFEESNENRRPTNFVRPVNVPPGGFDGVRPAFDGINGNPGFDNRNPGFNNRGPSFDNRGPGFDNRGPGFNGNQQPGFGGNPPGFQGNRPGFIGNRPEFVGGRPGFEQPPPGFEGRQPGFDGTRPGFDGGRPGYDGPRPGNSRPKPPQGNNRGPGILTGPVPSWQRPPLYPNNDPTNFDTCKCTHSFNCKSPGIQFGSCDSGKQYCCYNSPKYGLSDRLPQSYGTKNGANKRPTLVGPGLIDNYNLDGLRPDLRIEPRGQLKTPGL